ncbi:Inherit from bactNOG: (LipO)protein [Seminavis robusta]|uniref:Inherit from bactNOG: (LipO)protein n=1 Tax=Seminavis robusta TaxID=568900 RepID=A0A9N8ECZ3_9STRA|nr:Inherit from bactNOG: (LipO)protein [Seminavis robusta]|eukprot:Sro815_g206490.1 Inherit from bactNOG: (LipO)protein (882) ;mRNA; f:18135-20780
MSNPSAHQSRYLASMASMVTNGTEDRYYDDDSVAYSNATYWGNESTSTPTTTEPETDPYYSNKWLLILPRLTAVISLFAIVCVAIEAWKDLAATKKTSAGIRSTARKRASTITHIQLFYQIPLLCQAIVFAVGSSAAPKGEVWGAIGNTATCTVQGFLLQFGVYATIGWDASLSATYLLMVRYKVAELQLQSWKQYYHWIIWPPCLAVSIYPLFASMYNVNGTVCWLETYPNHCVGDECIRGAGAPIWQTLTSFLTMFHLFYSFSIMICLYCSIRGLENQTQRYSSSSVNGSSSRPGSSDNVSTQCSVTTVTSRRCSRAVGIQGMLYASGMLLTGLPTPIYIVLWNTAGLWSDGYAIFATALLPLMGYVNFVIFMRNRSVAQCHTRYAKFLRRAHSWIFDYEIHCHCRCWRKPDDEEGQSPLVFRIPTIHSRKEPGRTEQHTRTMAPMPPVAEDGDGDLEDGEKEGVPGRWTGFLILCKQKSKRFSHYISELSAGSVDDSEFETYCDSAPSKPVRTRSEAERPPMRPVRFVSEAPDLETIQEARSHNGSTPPTKPVRYESCVPDLTEVEDEDDESRFNQSSGSAKPPTRPTRYVSEVEPHEEYSEHPTVPLHCVNQTTSSTTVRFVTDDIERPPTMPVRYISEVESPQMPVRYISEVEPLEGEAPPIKPIRLVSEAEPPTMPERFVSEVETTEPEASLKPVIFGKKLGSPTKPERYRVGTAAFKAEAPPSKPARFVSEAEPPTKPMRYISEVEAPEPVGGQPPSKPVRFASEAEPPTKPMRFISEVEAPEPVDGQPPSKPVRFVSEAEPPTKPMRYISEVEAPEQACGAPPSKPVRYVSEVEALEVSPTTQPMRSAPLSSREGSFYWDPTNNDYILTEFEV